jgi:arginyl-tRNA synthetase
MSPLLQAKIDVVKALKDSAGLEIKPEELVVPEAKLGDLALPCFRFAKDKQTAPNVVAFETAEKINLWLDTCESNIAKVEAAGPYLNIFLQRHSLAILVSKATNQHYGESHGEGKNVLVEYISPNTNKPLHLGHIRNATYGWSIMKLLAATGSKVTLTQIINDRGISIMQAVIGYHKWANGETPESSNMSGDALVAKYYVMFNKQAQENENLKTEAQDWLRRWESGDKEVYELWQKLSKWTLGSHNQTEERLGVTTDKKYYESDIYKFGKKIVDEAVKNGFAQIQVDGSVTISFKKEEIKSGEDIQKILLRADGTSVYITQDLALVEKRKKDFNPDQLIWITAHEQDLQFRILIETIKKIGLAENIKLTHLSYGLVNLPEGRMKSREGTVIDADTLLDELNNLAKEEIVKREPELSDDEIEHRAKIISLAAVKFYMLRVGAKSDIKFDPTESISFTGKTGPYLLYTVARLNSIFAKAQGVPKLVAAPTEITDNEWILLSLIARFPDEVKKAVDAYDPAIIAEYSYELSQRLSEFYEKEPVLKAEPDVRAWRLNLLKYCHTTLVNSLSLMGIETLERM